MAYVVEKIYGLPWRAQDFRADGTPIGYAESKGQSKWMVGWDGHLGNEYDSIVMNTVHFLADGSLEYVGVRNNTLYRVCHPR